MAAWRAGVVVVRTLGFVVVRRLLGLICLGAAPDAKDIESAVLRHQLVVLQRQVARPRYTPTDRIVPASLARLMSRERWALFLVTAARCCGGTGSWSVSAGPIRRVAGRVVDRWSRRWSSWCYGWRGRIRAVGICGWWGSAASSALRCPRHRYARSFAGIISDRHHAVAARPGRSFCGRRPLGSWPVTS
jgi:hypothetical protein